MAVINDGTRSGKEGIAFQLRKSHRALLVGSTTIGHFIGAALTFADPERQFLVETPTNLLLMDGQRLEGVGVRPDIEVDHPLQGDIQGDPQMEAAIEQMRRLFEAPPPVHPGPRAP